MAAPGAISALVQNTGDRLFPAVLREELVYEGADGALLGMRHELPVLPLVSEGGGPANWAPHLGADRNGRGDALGNLFTLPLRHSRDDGEEEAPGRRAGVDCFLERDEVRLGFPKDIRKFEKFPGVPRQSGDLREDERRDVAGANVRKHALRFGMAHDGFAGHGFEPIYFAHRPLPRLCEHTGAPFVNLGAFAPCLIFGTDAYPNTHSFLPRSVLLRCGFHGGCPRQYVGGV